MSKAYVLYNPLAGNGRDTGSLSALEVVMDAELVFQDITAITNYRVYLGNLQPEDIIILAGGDGTLNRFINATDTLDIPNEILYYPIGSGNDFAKDLGQEAGCTPFPITQYLKDLPTVEINGVRRRFLNGVGYGVDGYCCEVGDIQRAIPGKKVNYPAIAIKGLLFHFKPRSAVVTVDGVRREYKKVWIAPTMHGRYYGGGMMPTPNQDRLNGHARLSLMVFHGSGKLKTLAIFPGIFKGTHVRHTDVCEILEGSQITVEFDRPTALQIDGETVLNVTAYTATAAKVPTPV